MNDIPETLDNNNLHNNELGGNRYPEPDVPVQQAWDAMQQLLLQPPAVSAQPSGLKKWAWKGMGKLLIGAGVAATVSVITWVVIKNKEQQPVSPETYDRDNVAVSQPVVASDTIPSAAKEKTASFEYDDAPIKKVALDIEKAYDIKVVLMDNVGEYNITVRFDRVTLKEMLRMISLLIECRYKMDKENRQVTIFKNEAKK